MRLGDNRGISLLELIMAISILAILAAGTLGLYSRFGGADTDKAAKMIDTVMEKVRMETMCRSRKQYLYLYGIGNSVYYKNSPEADPLAAVLNSSSGRKLANSITISYKITAGMEETLDSGEYICISFERSSGVFNQNYEYIEMNGPNDTAAITCIPETGRHWTD